MKKLSLIAAFLLPFLAFGQINLENTYNYSGTYTRLSNSGDKFYIMDVAASQCRVYNANHTLWKTINLTVPSGNYLYDIKYLSENLFTTDNSLCLAYVYYYYDETNQFYTFNARIVKENGTELLTIPGCQYLEVVKTASSGTKLITYSYDYSQTIYTITTRVYGLPGTITSTGDDMPQLQGIQTMPAFPNPASAQVTIPFALPEGSAPAMLKLSNSSGDLIKESLVLPGSNKQLMDVSGLPAGIYFFNIKTSTGQHSGKVLVQ